MKSVTHVTWRVLQYCDRLYISIYWPLKQNWPQSPQELEDWLFWEYFPSHKEFYLSCLATSNSDEEMPFSSQTLGCFSQNVGTKQQPNSSIACVNSHSLCFNWSYNQIGPQFQDKWEKECDVCYIFQIHTLKFWFSVQIFYFYYFFARTKMADLN